MQPLTLVSPIPLLPGRLAPPSSNGVQRPQNPLGGSPCVPKAAEGRVCPSPEAGRVGRGVCWRLTPVSA